MKKSKVAKLNKYLFKNSRNGDLQLIGALNEKDAIKRLSTIVALPVEYDIVDIEYWEETT